MPGMFRHSVNSLIMEIKEARALGIRAFMLFPAVNEELKNSTGTEGLNQEGLYLSAAKRIKQDVPEAWLISDCALDPYSSDGHDGLVRDGKILNDETVEILAEMAVAQAKAGFDMIGPSDMMDGRVGAIRKALDDAGFEHVSVMSYAAKYASGFYGPFREALQSAPKFGDKKTYQMDPANAKEALLEARLDVEEGADVLMVKPGLPYLDIVHRLANELENPIAVYQVSGEYAMIKAAALNGWIDGERVMMETLLAFKRAGAKIIITYFAKEAAALLHTKI